MKRIGTLLLTLGLSLFLCSMAFAQSSCPELRFIFGEGGRGHVGELEYFTVCPSNTWEEIHYSVLQLPPGFAPSVYQDGDNCINIGGSPTEVGTFTFSIAASGSNAGGTCSDTLTWSQTYVCFPPGSFQPLDPAPDALSSGAVGEPYNQLVAVMDNGYETGAFRFEVTSGALPPGLSLNANPNDRHSKYLAGTPTAAGDYDFTINVFLESCTLPVEESYVLHVAPTDCGPISVRSDYIGQEFHVGDSITVNHPFVDGGTPPYVFSAISLMPGGTLTPAGALKFYASHPGNYDYTIRVTDSEGCTDTFSSTVGAMCNPIARTEATLPNGKKGQYYEQPVPTTTDIVGPFSNFQTGDHLPAGLTLSTDGIISGTPTEYGIFKFIDIIYYGLAGCSGRTLVNITILNDVPVKTLFLYSHCSESDQVRNWRVYNQNNFNVNVTWETLYYNVHQGSFTAVPGDNFFTTPNVGGPNTIRIKWADANANVKSLVQPSANNLCNPPACAIATSVDFYHQGQQKNGQHVASEFSNPASALGEPDANDAADGGTHAFSLGFDGFIILQLNANLADQPGNDLTVYEYSAGNPSFYSYPERAEVFVSKNGSQWVSLGVTSPGPGCQQKLDTEFDLAGKIDWCRYVRILDVTYRHSKILNATTCAPTSVLAFNDASNGFDLDAVGCVQSNNNSSVASRRMEGAPKEGSPHDNASINSVLYPNPTAGSFVIDFSNEPEFVFPDGGEVQVDILDMTGTSVYNRVQQLDDQWTTKCDVNYLPSGLFVTKVKAGAGSHVYKFVKY